MKVLSRGLPARQLRRRDRLRGRGRASSRDIRDSEHAGIVIIHQELALIPELSIAENIFLGNENVARGRDRLGPDQPRGRTTCSRGSGCRRTR